MKNPTISEPKSQLYRVSWIAFVSPVVVFAIMFLTGVALSTSPHEALRLSGCFLIDISVIIFIIRIIYIRSLKLIINEDGVYLYRRVFPWTKIFSGVMWREVSDASYYAGMSSQITQSYRIKIENTYTTAREINLAHIQNGNKAVRAIKGFISTHNNNVF